MLALAVMAGGMMAASAATVTIYNAYDITADFTNAAKVLDIFGGPATVSGFASITSDLDYNVDGSGKITGAGWVRIDYSSNAAPSS